jgi:tRNA (guanine-N7-)-methyltransferase
VEIGMGKGRFVREMARMHPEIDFIGMERYASVLMKALQGVDRDGVDRQNLRFLCMDAAALTEVFGPGEVGKIYLNFPDPWPKKRHAHRRLTSGAFLDRFAAVLGAAGGLELKTDNRELFAFSLENLGDKGWEIAMVTEDLHAWMDGRGGGQTTGSGGRWADGGTSSRNTKVGGAVGGRRADGGTCENVETEYEIKFARKGKPICKLVAFPPKLR